MNLAGPVVVGRVVRGSPGIRPAGFAGRLFVVGNVVDDSPSGPELSGLLGRGEPMGVLRFAGWRAVGNQYRHPRKRHRHGEQPHREPGGDRVGGCGQHEQQQPAPHEQGVPAFAGRELVLVGRCGVGDQNGPGA